MAGQVSPISMARMVSRIYVAGSSWSVKGGQGNIIFAVANGSLYVLAGAIFVIQGRMFFSEAK